MVNFKKGDILRFIDVGSNGGTIAAKHQVGKIVTAYADSVGDFTAISEDGGATEADCGELYNWRFEKVSGLDFTKDIVTKQGVKFTLLTTKARGNYPIIGYIGDDDKPLGFTPEGKYFYDGSDSIYDLQVEVKTRDVYMNVYKSTTGKLHSGGEHATLASAASAEMGGIVGRVKVTLVEGQYDA